MLFFKLAPASLATVAPPRSEPVRQAPATRLSAIALFTWSYERNKLVKLPAGAPASLTASANAWADAGQFDASFKIMGFPTIKLGINTRAI